MTHLLLANPTSGGGRGASIGNQTKEILRNRGIEFRDISGTSYESARTNLRAELAMECSSVIVIGGDGMVHLAIQELAGSSIPLIVIPAGTGNDFARTMSLPLDDPAAIIDRCLGSLPGSIDLGRANGEFFADILSTGFDSLVNERANRMRWIKGNAKYNLSILLELPIFKPLDYSFRIDDQTFSTPAMLIAVGNGSSYGGGMLVCPDADPSDGLFDIMILGPVSKMEFLKVFPKVFTGAHKFHPAVSILRGKEVEISAPSIAYADGERIGPLPVKASVVPRSLRTWRF